MPTGAAMRIAIYDLDRTLTRRATFTPFLLFAARKAAPWRLLFAPVWILAMLAYRMGTMSRARLKLFGMRLLVGRRSRRDLEGFDDVVATRWQGFDRVPDNCYADTKLASVSEQLPALGQAHTRFVSDSFADAPLLDAVSDPIFAATSRRKAGKAAARNWRVIDPRDP